MLNPRIWLQGGLLLGVVSVVLADSGFLPNLFRLTIRREF